MTSSENVAASCTVYRERDVSAGAERGTTRACASAREGRTCADRLADAARDEHARFVGRLVHALDDRASADDERAVRLRPLGRAVRDELGLEPRLVERVGPDREGPRVARAPEVVVTRVLDAQAQAVLSGKGDAVRDVRVGERVEDVGGRAVAGGHSGRLDGCGSRTVQAVVGEEAVAVSASGEGWVSRGAGEVEAEGGQRTTHSKLRNISPAGCSMRQCASVQVGGSQGRGPSGRMRVPTRDELRADQASRAGQQGWVGRQ